MATGINSAIAPTLFMKPDSTAPRATSANKLMVLPARRGNTARVSADTAPELCRPRLNTSTQATVTTAAWPNPANASLGATMPARTHASSAATATMS